MYCTVQLQLKIVNGSDMMRKKICNTFFVIHFVMHTFGMHSTIELHHNIFVQKQQPLSNRAQYSPEQQKSIGGMTSRV